MSRSTEAPSTPSLFDEAGEVTPEAAGTAPVRGAEPGFDPFARAAELNRQLDYHAYRYYALDDPEITDAAFDKLVHELRDAGWALPEDELDVEDCAAELADFIKRKENG